MKLRRVILFLLAFVALAAAAQRRVTPVNTPATATQPVNEFKDDTARMAAKMRAATKHYHDAEGNVVYVDTVTGREWRDSTAIKVPKRMSFPLLHSASVGVDIWDPIMRAFGQHYGLIGFSANLSLHNRFMPAFEVGLGNAKNTPSGGNFTYRTPMSVYFKLGMDYNFLFNSTPDYQFLAGVRYGFSSFNYDITDVTVTSPDWGVTVRPTIPTQSATVGWLEVCAGLRVKLFGPISAGWTFRYHTILHEPSPAYGKPWYVPGYGSRASSIGGSFSIFYTLPLRARPVVNDSESN